MNVIAVKTSAEFKDAHVTIPEGAPPITPYNKANIQNGYVLPQESPVYRKPENYEHFRKQNRFGAANPNVQIDAKLDYLVSQVLLKMDHTILSIYKKL